MSPTARHALLSALTALVLAAPSCRRAPGSRPSGDSEATRLVAEPSGRPASSTTDRAQPGPAPRGVAGAAAPADPMLAAPKAREAARDTATPPAMDAMGATGDKNRLSTDPRSRKKAEQPPDDGGKVGLRRLDMPEPAPLQLATAGAEPRVALRYRLAAGDRIVWEAEVTQRTELRQEKQCAPFGTPAHHLRAPDQTIPLGYKVEVVSRVTSALRDRFTLETGFRKARLTLPPSLLDQRALLETLVGSANYSTTMSRTGRVGSFTLGKLTGVSMTELLDRVRTPLGMLQPVLPAPRLGVGAIWRHVHKLALPQPGGRVDAQYTSTYRLAKLETSGASPAAVIQVVTSVILSGQVMGKEYRGEGRGRSVATLDPRSGLLRTARGEMRICAAVLGRSSTNQTTYRQTFLPAASSLGAGAGKAPADGMAPGGASAGMAAPGTAAPGGAAAPAIVPPMSWSRPGMAVVRPRGR